MPKRGKAYEWRGKLPAEREYLTGRTVVLRQLLAIARGHRIPPSYRGIDVWTCPTVAKQAGR